MWTRIMDFFTHWLRPKEDQVNYTSPETIRRQPKWLAQVTSDLKRHEGFREYAYPDPLSPLARDFPATRYPWGYQPAEVILANLGQGHRISEGAPWTVGYGFTHGVTFRTRMSETHATRVLEAEILEHIKGLEDLVPNWRELPLFASSVLANMIYNLGYKKLSAFAPTLALIERGEWEKAAARLRNTLWYKQVKSRGVELADRLRDQMIRPEHIAKQ